MKCTFCGSVIEAQDERCPSCGYPRKINSGKGRRSPGHLPFILLAVLITGLIAAGIVLFVSYQVTGSTMDTPPVSVPVATQPVPSDAPDESLPWNSESTVPSDAAVVIEDCFQITNGILSFLPEKYDGGPILNIPASVGGQKVTGLAPDCFRNCDQITTITLPDGIVTIGAGAFADCTRLRGIYFPNSVTIIGKEAFLNAGSLESVYIPESVESIGKNAFSGCTMLRFIFFNGYSAEWIDLYWEFVTPFTYAICLDTDLHHGAKLP